MTSPIGHQQVVVGLPLELPEADHAAGTLDVEDLDIAYKARSVASPVAWRDWWCPSHRPGWPVP